MAEITQSQLAKIAGLKRQAIYNAVRRGQLDINSSNMIDTQNKKNSQWLSSRGISEQMVITSLSEITEKKQPQKKTIARSEQKAEIQPKIQIVPNISQNVTTFESSSQEEIEFESVTGLAAKMMNLNLKQLVMRYGGPMMLDSWSKILQRLMSANEKDQKIQERRLELIDKDFVISKVFSYLETLSLRMFDYTENIPMAFIALIKSDAENIEFKIKDKMRRDFSDLINDAKANINRELENLKSKYEKIKDESDNTD